MTKLTPGCVLKFSLTDSSGMSVEVDGASVEVSILTKKGVSLLKKAAGGLEVTLAEDDLRWIPNGDYILRPTIYEPRGQHLQKDELVRINHQISLKDITRPPRMSYLCHDCSFSLFCSTELACGFACRACDQRRIIFYPSETETYMPFFCDGIKLERPPRLCDSCMGD